jgi:hypothetical protein
MGVSKGKLFQLVAENNTIIMSAITKLGLLDHARPGEAVWNVQDYYVRNVLFFFFFFVRNVTFFCPILLILLTTLLQYRRISVRRYGLLYVRSLSWRQDSNISQQSLILLQKT